MPSNQRTIESTNYRFLLLLAPLILSGCDWIGRQADALGEHMPVIGERCEHWQCFTSEGQAESNAIKAEQNRQQQQNQPQPLSSVTPIYPPDQATPPPPADAAPATAPVPDPARKQFPMNDNPSAAPDSGPPPL